MTWPTLTETLKKYLPFSVSSVPQSGEEIEGGECTPENSEQVVPTYSDIYHTSSVERECSQSTWIMNWNCGIDASTNFPENYVEPWVLTKTTHPIISRLATSLATIQDPLVKAKKIVEFSKRELSWEMSDVPTGNSPDQMLSTPSGNCVDVTVFLLALFKHFDVPADIVFVNDEENHVCLVIKDSAGLEHLIDLTLDPSFDVVHASWYRISERELASMYFVGAGVLFSKNNQYQMATRSFESALAVCPGQTDALIDSALLYMTEERRDLPKAGQYLASLDAISYHSYWADYARAYFAYLSGNEKAAIEALENAEASCQVDQSATDRLRKEIQNH